MADFNVSFPGLGIHDIAINREAFSIFGFSIYWYGIIAACAMLLSMYLSLRRAKKYNLNKDDLLDYFIFLIPGVLVGARLYYVIFSWQAFKDNLLSILDTRTGGMAFYGGVIGGCLALFLVALYKKQNIWKILDYLAPYLALGQGIGRFANFFNQEAFGTNTTLPWGMISNGTQAYLATVKGLNVDPHLPVHPTFFYEFLGNMLIFTLLICLQRRLQKREYQQAGLVAAAYAALYGFLRFFVEGIRTDALYIGSSSIRVSQLLSLIMVLAAIFYTLFYLYKRALYFEKLEAEAATASVLATDTAAALDAAETETTVETSSAQLETATAESAIFRDGEQGAKAEAAVQESAKEQPIEAEAVTMTEAGAKPSNKGE